MRYSIILLLAFFSSCDYGSFNKDKRQIMAKDAIRSQLPAHAHEFDITGFREDTVEDPPDPNFKRTISYTIDYQYTDSTGSVQKKRGLVFFAPDGQSIITTTQQP